MFTNATFLLVAQMLIHLASACFSKTPSMALFGYSVVNGKTKFKASMGTMLLFQWDVWLELITKFVKAIYFLHSRSFLQTPEIDIGLAFFPWFEVIFIFLVTGKSVAQIMLGLEVVVDNTARGKK